MMKDKLRQVGEQNLRYNANKCKKKGNFYILIDMIENATLAKLMVTLGNVNNDISIVGHWIFDSNYEKALHLTRE